MTVTLERTDPRPLTWRQRYQRLLWDHKRLATLHSIVGVAICAALVLTLDVAYRSAEGPAPPPDHPADTAFSMAMVGDIMFGRHVEEVTAQHGLAFPLDRVREHLARADHVTGNLEQAVLTDDPSQYEQIDKFIHLSTGPEALEALAEAGFSSLNLANNHAMDFGELGLAETMLSVEEAGMSHTGAGISSIEGAEIDYEDFGDITVAMLGFSDVYVADFTAQPFRGGVLPADPEVVGPIIREAREEADLVVAHVHWGEEYDWAPTSRQIELGRTMADEGADIIIGHHPHVLMPVEHYGDSVIFYSLGNFVFDQGWTRTRESAIAEYVLAEDGTATIELTPVLVREGQPRPLHGALARYRQSRIFAQLDGWAEGWQREGDTMTLQIDHTHVQGGLGGE